MYLGNSLLSSSSPSFNLPVVCCYAHLVICGSLVVAQGKSKPENAAFDFSVQLRVKKKISAAA